MADEIVKAEPIVLAIAAQVETALKTRDPEQMTLLYRNIEKAGGMLNKWRDMLKSALKEAVLKTGTETGDKGSRELVVGDYKVPVRAMTAAGTLDDKKVEAKLRAKGLNPHNYMIVEEKWHADRGLLGVLAADGKWTEQDFKDCEVERKWALYPPEKVNKDE